MQLYQHHMFMLNGADRLMDLIKEASIILKLRLMVQQMYQLAQTICPLDHLLRLLSSHLIQHLR